VDQVFGLVLGEVGGAEEVVEFGGLGVGEVRVEGREVRSRKTGAGRGGGRAGVRGVRGLLRVQQAGHDFPSFFSGECGVVHSILLEVILGK